MVKRFGLPLLALLAVCGFALNAADSEIEQLKQMIKAQNAKIDKLEKAQSSSAATSQVDKAVASKGACYLAPDRPDIKGTGLSFTGEFLYWKPVLTGTEYVATGYKDNVTFDPYYQAGGTAGVDPDWAPGFRLSLSYALPYEGWDIKAGYTYLRADGEDTKTDPTGELQLSPLLVNAYDDPTDSDLEYAHASNDFSLDVITFDVGRNTKVSESLSIRPFVGFQYTKVSNEVKALYAYDYLDPVNGDHYRAKTSSETDLYGIRIGSDVDLKLRKGFSLYGNVAGALLSGEITSKWSDSYYEAGVYSYGIDAVKNTIDVIVPAVQIGAGVAWETKINGKLHFKTSLGYEYNAYFGAMNGFREYMDDNGEDSMLHNDKRDVGVHGLTFRIRLDF